MTYEEFCSFETLWNAYVRARRSKRSKGSTAVFEYNAIEELLILSKSLLRGTHQPDPLDAFLIYEPKKRLIQAPTFRDKVVQHALTDFIVYDELSRSLTLNTYAAQYGKGTHYGLKMLEKHMRTHFLRRKGADEAARRAAGLPYRPMEEWDYADGAVIKGDIRHFFQSIDHGRLKAA
ncbi:MAG: reverse transcriptase, partial [Clostridia bacterium]|nr:reverse transcriptase [Clostridia bacterium]